MSPLLFFFNFVKIELHIGHGGERGGKGWRWAGGGGGDGHLAARYEEEERGEVQLGPGT
jgi:hypothetical protein